MKLGNVGSILNTDKRDCGCLEDIWSENLNELVIKHIKSGTMVEGAKFWAIDFFNITEEELE